MLANMGSEAAMDHFWGLSCMAVSSLSLASWETNTRLGQHRTVRTLNFSGETHHLV
jgi:hypothetical protein